MKLLNGPAEINLAGAAGEHDRESDEEFAHGYILRLVSLQRMRVH
jgi:hypothetical protein